MARSNAKTSAVVTEADAPIVPTQAYDQATPINGDRPDKDLTNVRYTAARNGIKSVVEQLVVVGMYPSDAASVTASTAMEEVYNQQIGYVLRNLAELRCGDSEMAQKKFIQEVLLDDSLGGFKSIQIRVGKIVSINPLLVTVIQVQDAGRRIRTVFASELGSDEMKAIKDKRKTNWEASQTQS